MSHRTSLAAVMMLLLAACGREPPAAPPATAESAELAPTSRLSVLRDEGNTRRFAIADAPRSFEFPADHGPHPEFRHEWWYTTGHLEATTGERFGFELTFFRFALQPREAVARIADPSAWRTNEIFAAHFAVTDLDRKQFHFDERYSRGALGLAGAQAEPFRVWLEDWSLAEPSAPAPDAAPGAPALSRPALPIAPSQASAPTHAPWQLRAAAQGYELRLDVQPLSAAVLNGDAGLSRKSSAPGAASYYYSIPRMALRGQLVRDGRALQVQGLAWLDREWGSGALAANQTGWDWFALQLDDGSALMFYSLRQRGGGQDAASAGTWIAPDGTASPLASADVRIEVLEAWTSPRGGTYPARWRLRIPRLMMDVDVRPLLADQELQTNPRYWEGAVAVTGERAGGAVGGKGYVELVGYADERE